MGYFIKRNLIGNSVEVGSTAERPTTPHTRLIRYNNDTGGIEYYDGTNYVELAKSGRVVPPWDTFIGDGIQTVFNLSVTPPGPRDIIVFVDGIFQQYVQHWTLSGSTLTFLSAVPNTLRVYVIHGYTSTYVLNEDVYDVPNL